MTSPGAKRVAARACASAEHRFPVRYERTAKPADGDMSIIGQETHLKAVAVNDAGQILGKPAEDVTWTVPSRSRKTLLSSSGTIEPPAHPAFQPAVRLPEWG